MQDTIPMSIDDRRFTFWEWLSFVFSLTFFTVFFVSSTFGTLGSIWKKILIGDFTSTDVSWSIGLTIIAIPFLFIFNGMLHVAAVLDPFNRGSVSLDASHLDLEERHITGFFFRKSLALTDVRDVSVEWTKGEDGRWSATLQLIQHGGVVLPTITNPDDAADLPAFAARLRAELATIGWTDASACGCPQGDAVPKLC